MQMVVFQNPVTYFNFYNVIQFANQFFLYVNATVHNLKEPLELAMHYANAVININYIVYEMWHN